MSDRHTLLREGNRTSLRIAQVRDNGNLVVFHLRPADWVWPKEAPKDDEWLERDVVWLYRHMRSDSDELKLKQEFPCVEHDIKAMSFKSPPEFKLLWTESGKSVALYLNGEPWAFILEATHRGYSKGILPPRPNFPPAGMLWDQELFERTFLG